MRDRTLHQGMTSGSHRGKNQPQTFELVVMSRCENGSKETRKHFNKNNKTFNTNKGTLQNKQGNASEQARTRSTHTAEFFNINKETLQLKQDSVCLEALF